MYALYLFNLTNYINIALLSLEILGYTTIKIDQYRKGCLNKHPKNYFTADVFLD